MKCPFADVQINERCGTANILFPISWTTFERYIAVILIMHHKAFQLNNGMS